MQHWPFKIVRGDSECSEIEAVWKVEKKKRFYAEEIENNR
jgi:hypothetical protein